MRRFLLFTVLLVLTLLVARGVDARGRDSWNWSRGEGDHSRWRATAEFGYDRQGDELLPFFDHDVVPRSEPAQALRNARRRHDDLPLVIDGELRLRYRDRGYDRVLVEFEEGNWDPLAMHLDASETAWEIFLPLPEHGLHYRFVVQYDDGRQRSRVDPSHPGRQRIDGVGWVSVLGFDASGKLDWSAVEGRSPMDTRRDDYDLDVTGNLGLDYQRADGWLLTARPSLEPSARWAPTVAGNFGYGFQSHRWSVGLRFLQPLTPRGEVRAVLAAYDGTDFMDRTGVTGTENLLSTLVFHEDNRDYYRRDGASIGVEAQLQDRFLGRLEFRWDEYESLERSARAGWWGREDFLPMLPVDDGRMRSVYLRARLGTALHHLLIGYEISDPSFGTDFEFQQLILRYRTRLRTGRSSYFDLRTQWGATLSGELPRQKRYLLGGVGTVRGYNYQSLLRGTLNDPESYGGQQMVLATAEYVLGVEESIGVALFADTGMAYTDRTAALRLSDLESSAGVGVIFGGEEGVRLDLIRTLDDGGGDFVLQGRLQRAF